MQFTWGKVVARVYFIGYSDSETDSEKRSPHSCVNLVKCLAKYDFSPIASSDAENRNETETHDFFKFPRQNDLQGFARFFPINESVDIHLTRPLVCTNSANSCICICIHT